MTYTTPELMLVGQAQNLVLGLVPDSDDDRACIWDNDEMKTSDLPLSW